MAQIPDHEFCHYGDYRIMYDEYDPAIEDRQLVIYWGSPLGPEWLGPMVWEYRIGDIRYYSVDYTDLRDTEPERLLARYAEHLGADPRNNPRISGGF